MEWWMVLVIVFVVFSIIGFFIKKAVKLLMFIAFIFIVISILDEVLTLNILHSITQLFS